MQGYSKAGVTNKAMSALRQGTDYMLKCNLAPSFGSSFAYVAQVLVHALACAHLAHAPRQPT